MPHLRSRWPLYCAAFVFLAFAAVGWYALLMPRLALAPQVVFTTIKGEKLPLPSFKGKVVLVNFWAPSCAPCIREMPMLAASYGKLHARGLEVVGVAANFDAPNIVIDYAETRHIPFPIALDVDNHLVQAFGGLEAVPTTYVIGRDGRIVWHVEGALDPAALEQVLEKQLGSA